MRVAVFVDGKNFYAGWRTADRPHVDFTIGPQRKETLSFEIINNAALSGATYPLFCYLEYDTENSHHTAVVQAKATIAEQEMWFQRTSWFWIGAAVLLGMLLAAYQLKRKP